MEPHASMTIGPLALIGRRHTHRWFVDRVGLRLQLTGDIEQPSAVFGVVEDGPCCYDICRRPHRPDDRMGFQGAAELTSEAGACVPGRTSSAVRVAVSRLVQRQPCAPDSGLVARCRALVTGTIRRRADAAGQERRRAHA
jgi:hypothetical protein